MNRLFRRGLVHFALASLPAGPMVAQESMSGQEGDALRVPWDPREGA